MFNLIPDKVDLDKNISPNSKRLMGRIISLNSSQIGCIASNRYLAELIGVSIPSLKRYLKELKQADYIIIDFKERKTGTQDIRIIIPSSNILHNMKETKTALNKKMNSSSKNLLPVDPEIPWLDEYISNIE